MMYLILVLPLLQGLSCLFLPERDGKGKIAYFLALQTLEVGLVGWMVCRGGSLTSGPVYVAEALAFALRWDGFSSFFAVLVSVCWLLSVPYSAVYLRHEEHRNRFYLFFFLTESALLGTSFAGNFVTLYLLFELATMFSFPLVLHDHSPMAVLGGQKYLYYSVGGAFVALFGIGALYFATGGLALTQGGTLTELTSLTALAVFCMILGFGAKAGLYPLHNWLPTAHPVAPSPASAVLSGLITKAGVVAILRLLFNLVGPELLRGTWVQYAAITLALIGVAMGSFMGCVEMNLKKRLAFSSVSQISYVLLGLFILTPHGLVGGLMQVLFHAVAKIGAFQCAGAVIFLTGYTRVDELRGMGRRAPVTMLCFTVFSLSLVGIPPFGGFWSKWHLCLAALEGLPTVLSYLVPAVLILSALLTAGYLFAPVISAFFPGEDCPQELTSPVKEPPMMMVSLIALSLVCLVPGLIPDTLVSLMERIVGTLM